MKFLLLLFFAGYAVRCDDSLEKKPFKVYWNVPTFQCTSKKLPFENLFSKFGIIQNNNDDFRGDKIAILYDPGSFPAYVKDKISGEFDARNGGVPQEGNLDDHLSSFRDVLDSSITDPDFSGVGVIDFQAWRPVFRQHWGAQSRYKTESYEIEKNKPGRGLSASRVAIEAKQSFEEAARKFMENTLTEAKKLRPNAQWGYYGFPYCFNRLDNDIEQCSEEVTVENDGLSWLWSESTALFPSVYSTQDLTSSQLELLLKGRVSEAARVRQNEAPILPYFWFNYRGGPFMTEDDIKTAVETFYKSEASGFIIWGSSNDVNTEDKCGQLLNYVENTLGPAVAKYTKTIDDGTTTAEPY